MNDLYVFRLIAQAEGLSLIALVCVAMPLKYLYGIPEAVSLAGMAHGLLFVLFSMLLMWVSKRRAWPDSVSSGLMVAALIPFGTFYMIHKLKAQGTV